MRPCGSSGTILASVLLLLCVGHLEADPRAVSASPARRPRGISGLGLYSRDLSPRERAGLPPGDPAGVIITRVVGGSPAEAAELRPGQRVVRLDGRSFSNDDAFGAALAARPVGSDVQLEIRDGDREATVGLRLAERLSYLAPACDAGDGTSCWAIITLYGWHAAPPPGAAEPGPSWQHACDLGSLEACTQIGWRLVTAPEARRDQARGVRMLDHACDGGDPEACRVLATAYLQGTWGLPPSRQRALLLYEKGCDAGGAKSCLLAGQALDVPATDPSDLGGARTAYREACLRGIGSACRQIGLLWRDGRGGSKDAARAAVWLQRACESDVVDGCVDLLDVLGRISAVDAQRGVQLAREECAASGEADCSFDGFVFGGANVTIDMRRWAHVCDRARQPAVSRSFRICPDFGFLYEPGTREELRGEEALASAVAACEDDNLLGCSWAGELLADGREVPADKPRAIRLLTKACDGKEPNGCRTLERIGAVPPACR